MSNHSSTDTNQMVVAYKKLFTILSVVTLIGISIIFFHLPLWIVFVAGFVLMIIKSKALIDAFKPLLAGRQLILILFGLTAVFFIAVLLLPVFNMNNHIVGTVDISKQLMMDEKPAEHGGGAHHGD